MKDMLVRLIGLPNITSKKQELLEKEGVLIRRPIAPERSLVVSWVKKHFSSNWADEVAVAFAHTPTRCFIAQRDQDILGFACFECTAKNYFGPTGVLDKERGKGIGQILLIESLDALKQMGYTYAIIGGVGPEAYYQKTVNAVPIEGSEISIYDNLLKHRR
ncbi:MAG: GNAT family N-acetyltransferase [Bacteroidota bacterium]